MAQGTLPDCHWTTLNFFNYAPQHYYLDTRNATNALLENFEKVDPPYRFGDVLMFMDTDGFARHSCNYLAADIVFTKNGRNPAIPWTLMELWAGKFQPMTICANSSVVPIVLTRSHQSTVKSVL